MKSLNINLRFTINDDYDPGEINELIYHMISENWDNIYEIGLDPSSYYIYEEKGGFVYGS